MPTKARSENRLIEIFLSAYENQSWADSAKEWLDEKVDGAVEILATRTSDHARLAIEHTIIQLFGDDKKDFARFAPVFLPIEQDKSLAIPERAIYVDVPAGTLQEGKDWNRIGKVTHEWLKGHAASFPSGRSFYSFTVEPAQKEGGEKISLSVRTVSIPGFEGKLFIRRCGPTSLAIVVEKALRNKLPKLAKTAADKRILLLERDQFRLSERAIHEEIEAQRQEFPGLSEVHEIWFAETVFYKSEGIVEFSRYEEGNLVQSLSFVKGMLHLKVEDGVGFVVNRL
jgi:hypothetical protein